jgi:hypothetical protein
MKTSNGWNSRSSNSLKGSIISHKAQDDIGPDGKQVKIIPAPVIDVPKLGQGSDEKTTQRALEAK